MAVTRVAGRAQIRGRIREVGLHQLVLDLFNADVYGNIRRVQGLIRAAAKELQITG